MWLAHRFWLPLIYLLFNYISTARDILGRRLLTALRISPSYELILPLSIPALASFAIFQFCGFERLSGGLAFR